MRSATPERFDGACVDRSVSRAPQCPSPTPKSAHAKGLAPSKCSGVVPFGSDRTTRVRSDPAWGASQKHRPGVKSRPARRSACQLGTEVDGRTSGESNAPSNRIAASWVRWEGFLRWYPETGRFPIRGVPSGEPQAQRNDKTRCHLKESSGRGRWLNTITLALTLLKKDRTDGKLSTAQALRRRQRHRQTPLLALALDEPSEVA